MQHDQAQVAVGEEAAEARSAPPVVGPSVSEVQAVMAVLAAGEAVALAAVVVSVMRMVSEEHKISE
jgi:hypothetical protein